MENVPDLFDRKCLFLRRRFGKASFLLGQVEIVASELGTSVFIIPGARVKNGEDRLVVLNQIALSVINDRRGKHGTWVFSFKGHPIRCMLNTGWRTAREKAGLPHVRVHDLKHTFGRRLRAAGVSLEDR
jgi:integrase